MEKERKIKGKENRKKNKKAKKIERGKIEQEREKRK